MPASAPRCFSSSADTARIEPFISDGGTRKGDRCERPAPYIENATNDAYGVPHIRQRSGTFWKFMEPLVGPTYEPGIMSGPVRRSDEWRIEAMRRRASLAFGPGSAYPRRWLRVATCGHVSRVRRRLIGWRWKAYNQALLARNSVSLTHDRRRRLGKARWPPRINEQTLWRRVAAECYFRVARGCRSQRPARHPTLGRPPCTGDRGSGPHRQAVDR
jgi:hypothetical protein